MEGPTPSSNTSENICQKGNCYHWVSSAEPSLPWKLLPQTLENPLGGRDQNMRQSGESLVWKSETGVLSQFWGALGKASNFLLPPFSHTRDVQRNVIIGWLWGVIIQVEELQKWKGGDVQRKTGPVGWTLLLVTLAKRNPPLQCLSWFLSQRSVLLFLFGFGGSALCCSIPNTGCPRNALFVAKKSKGLKGKTVSFPHLPRSQQKSRNKAQGEAVPCSRC